MPASNPSPFRLQRRLISATRSLGTKNSARGLGEIFQSAVRHAIETFIAPSPLRWPARRGKHRYVMRRFPYTIAYLTDGVRVSIAAVAHHKRDPAPWQERRPPSARRSRSSTVSMPRCSAASRAGRSAVAAFARPWTRLRAVAP